ncbi:MAG TPA: DUF2812 domain-containing protein [Pseudobacteroides sp.]|uniref:DUF2812 domain-containing protein n=1 Tax=Pseudobacteroides sp. TaxID=1968840 RepID=UPI002F95C432
MRHTIYKFFFAWDFEKEEKWLNEMSAKGLQLVSVGFCKYVFEEGIHGEYTYKLELLENLPSNYESSSYIKFLEETGVEHIGSLFRWVYFRKKTTSGAFEIYSDIESKIKHYKRIMTLLACLIPVSVFPTILNWSRFYEEGDKLRLVLVSVTTILAILIVLGIAKTSRNIKRLKKEKLIRE